MWLVHVPHMSSNAPKQGRNRKEFPSKPWEHSSVIGSFAFRRNERLHDRCHWATFVVDKAQPRLHGVPVSR